MARLLASLLGLQKGERKMALLMAAYHFLLLVILYLLKPVRDSLFLADRGPAELPYVFILTTVMVVPVVILHTRLGQSMRVGRLIDGVTLFLAANLVGLYWLVALETAWAPYILYAWVSIFSLLVTSQFWLLANAIFGASQAKRVFTVLSAGAILGAIVGGEATGLLVRTAGIDSHALLFIAAAMLVGSVAMSRWIRQQHQARGGAVQVAGSNEEVPFSGDEASADAHADDTDASPVEDEDPTETAEKHEASSRLSAQMSGSWKAWSIIRSSRHLQLIVGVIAVMVITSTVVDFQFKTVAAQAFASEDALTSFMGRFYGRVSLVALVVQFFIAPRFIRILGIGGALSILPIALAGGTVAMILVPGLVAGVLIRGADQTLKHSIDKTGRELLFVPVSLEKKKQVKVFVDLFVDQGAQGVAGALLLLLTTVLSFSVSELGWVVGFLLAGWGVLAYLARRTYIHEFRKRLRAQEDTESSDEATPVSETLDELLESLCSRNERETLAALDQLEHGDETVPIDALVCLLDHYSPTVREQAIRVLRVRTIEGLGSEVVEALTDPNPDVQLEAARYLYCQSGERIDRLQEALAHDDVRIRAAAVGLIAEEGGPDAYRLITEATLRQLLDVPGEAGEDARTHVARILGVLNRSYRIEMLHSLLFDDSDQVVEAAIRAAGRSEERAFVYPLLVRLKEERFEGVAREALSRFGERVLGTLYDVMVDDRVNLDVRVQVPRILTELHNNLAVTVLVTALRDVPIPVQHAIVRALSRLHASGYDSFAFDDIAEAIRSEIRYYAALGQVVHMMLRTDRDAVGDVELSDVRGARERSLERIFRLLGLQYDQRDVYDAYLGLTSDDRTLRSSAIEFVDNLVDYSTSRILLPLLDDPEGRKALEYGQRFFDLNLRTPSDARAFLQEVDNPRLEGSESSDRGDMSPPDRGVSQSVQGRTSGFFGQDESTDGVDGIPQRRAPTSEGMSDAS
ncbi:hypothetical protein CRI94_08050 [Longibacter salinarum]|uniref:ADP,ATP carrier protein n=1 Tax=Longibacter salinarum TaxID=1850348 RepID=A0A2A8CZ61_9BACT|nr:Npt1/Npt2 family nucleotide transporter [Longibacter salinarum]PEN13992.1 hypothetical protein CRI94_08050 [Longibacter salinarum]